MYPLSNFPYYAQQTFAFLMGHLPPSLQAIPLQLKYIQYIEWSAIVVSIVSLINFVYFTIKAEEIEYHMQQRREEQEVALASILHGKADKNPRWLTVERLANALSESDWRRAIIEADSMLGELLTERGFPGIDIGEQLRGASTEHFSTLQSAWEAHRVRNRIAHEGESFQLTQRDAQAAIDQYRRVFEEFHYL